MAIFNGSSTVDFYIDLGTANTLIVSKKRGVVLNQPSVIAYNVKNKKVIAVGRDAKSKMGKGGNDIEVCYPLKDGVVADADVTELMLKSFFRMIKKERVFGKPTLLISVPHVVTSVERRVVNDIGLALGAKTVLLIAEPMVAAVGASLPVLGAKAQMIVDLGGGTTESAVIALGGIVHCGGVRLGGHRFDEVIVEALRKRCNLHIGPVTAEQIKIEWGSALLTSDVTFQVRGLDAVQGLPVLASVTRGDIQLALEPLILEIIGMLQNVFESIPAETASDIIDGHITLVGGGALLKDLPARIKQHTNLRVEVAREPLVAIANGGFEILKNGKLFRQLELLNTIFTFGD